MMMMMMVVVVVVVVHRRIQDIPCGGALSFLKLMTFLAVVLNMQANLIN